VQSYVFEVKVAGTVPVRAADEMAARKVVPAVLFLPGRVRMANEANAKIGWEATITAQRERSVMPQGFAGTTDDPPHEPRGHLRHEEFIGHPLLEMPVTCVSVLGIEFGGGDLEADRVSRCPNPSHIEHGSGGIDIEHDCQPAETRDNLAQKFETLGGKIGLLV
jgi:hypothetical protein